MTGEFDLTISSKRVKFQLHIKSNITIICGDSATGKTILVDMIRDHNRLGENVPITIDCLKKCVVLEGINWRDDLKRINNSIVFIDDGNSFISSKDFATAIKSTDNYYVIITRQRLSALPYSIDEIYKLRISQEFTSAKQTYNELDSIFHFEYAKASADIAETIFNILQTTIKITYSKYYPQEVVDFFCKHHSIDHIIEGISSGNMGVLLKDGVIVGTGCIYENHITGVYVLPSYHKQGCGSYIMDRLEEEISKKYDKSVLDASLAAVLLYEHRGYKTVGHGIYKLENDVRLVYEIMEKNL